ncbi:hypothetical protein D1006_35585 [Burkholderia stabilis]|uniref:Uncharacterized protein n=1 Tax=Burkholderia stabilis TaxID=95485 RepID=A0A4Q2A7R6_9BURK|nr:hypothetical protein D1006_35585 [Burkholderia stabilis]
MRAGNVARTIRCADACASASSAVVRGRFGRGEPEAKRSYQARPSAGIAGIRMLFMLMGR